MNKLKIKKVDDKLINVFLESRNLNFNRLKMINNKKISFNSHYIWWLNNNRSNYFISPKKNKFIFFWQEIIKFRKSNFLIGGWHSNIKKVNIFYILYILKWQFKYNKKNKINYEWLAVVRKNNKWVFKITKYLGYKTVSNKESIQYKAIKEIFKVSENKFYFLKK
jgi:hypothetical protein